ncbi:MAG: T9SS type A sorting domain-containing protein [Bacteroidales bacterium]|nr:T9SS type A sorting domain-containing protein [Bacteroidales bacterium]
MKSNKVLLGLFAGLMALTGGATHAQTANNFIEIGPANIGGKLSSVIVDLQDSGQTTLYAGAVSGGLYVRSTDTNVLKRLYTNVSNAEQLEALITNASTWHLVRYIDPATGKEEILPVSALLQGPDGTIYVGTGDDTYGIGSTYNKMSSKGRGIFRYKPSDGTFTVIPYSSPEQNELFGAVRKIEYIQRDNELFLYAATNTGLYRWVIDLTKTGADLEAEWDNNATLVQNGNIDQLVVSRTLNMGYFTIGNQLYKLSNLTLHGTQTPINISTSNSAFGGENTNIKLALAPSDNSHLYAMVSDRNGIMENIYLTTNGQVWTALATASVVPYLYSMNAEGDTVTYNSGATCGAIAVDPENPKRIFVGGTTIWTGEGFIDGANFQWTKNSYSEFELNRGDYMSGVFNTSVFVHSGIHQILPVYSVEPVYTLGDEEIHHTYYIVTDGGAYSTQTDFNSFDNLNRGMNNVQINSIAVTPDASIISGATNNSCPFIESRSAHHFGNNTFITWYDDGTMGDMNHDANILWTGNGGKVAASAFQQVNVQPHRNIFVSSANGKIGRSYADYLDYTNSQTWTTGSAFLTTEVKGGPAMGSLSLWESSNDTYFKDSIKVGFDMRGYYFPANAGGDTVWINQDTIELKAGDRAVFLSKNNSDYPFEFTFTQAFLNSFKAANRNRNATVADSFMVKNPIISRLLIVAATAGNQTSVMYSWTANDFSKIYDSITDAAPASQLDPDVKTALREKFMWWSPIYSIRRNNLTNTTNLYPRNAIMSPDGRFAYISTYDVADHRSQLIRINGFEKVNYNQYPNTTRGQLNAASDTTDRLLRDTKFLRSGNNEWFNRPISSIAVDPRPGQDRIILTFEDYSDAMANVMIIDNASTADWNNSANVTMLPITGHSGIPAYCALVEDSTGNIYVGTSDGVFVYVTNDGPAHWIQYDQLRGVPVTSIVQQTHVLPIRRHMTHTGITENRYSFAKTKWPRAIYFGTYGRGIFMDMTYVSDRENEYADPNVDIPTVNNNGESSISIFPNPVMGEANLAVNAAESGNAVLRIYDLNGRMVAERRLGYVSEGEQLYTIGTEGMAKGMYLVNVIIGGHTAASKMIVR